MRSQFDALRAKPASRSPGGSDSGPASRARCVPRRWWRTANWRVTSIILSRPCAAWHRTTQDGIDEDTGTRARSRRDRSSIGDDPAGCARALGQDVGAPDGVPPERLLSLALGRKTAKDVGGVLQRTVVKWIALYVPVRWPTELVTVPEVDQQVGGTAPVEFAADLAELSELFEVFTTRTRERASGRLILSSAELSRSAWLRWGYLHTDHHLRQFGA